MLSNSFEHASDSLLTSKTKVKYQFIFRTPANATASRYSRALNFYKRKCREFRLVLAF
jgi:hypothetical protein